MSEPVVVRVYDIVGGPLCVSAEDGQRLFDKIAPLVEAERPVVLSFMRIETMISAFLNAAVGQLYERFSEDRIRRLLEVEDMASDDQEVLRRVVRNAKLYFENSEDFDRAWEEELGDGEGEE